MKKQQFQYLTGMLLACLFNYSVFAESVANSESSSYAVHLGKETNMQEVIDLLAPKGQAKTRGIKLRPDPLVNPNEMPGERALSLEIYFDFDSAEIKDQAKRQLIPVGQALQSNELASLSFVVEGHTDSTGDDSYNMKLSEARAKSVKSFLVVEFELAENRIQAKGRGESQLQLAVDPASGKNRRVTIIAR